MWRTASSPGRIDHVHQDRDGADGTVGGYWTRTDGPENDLVITDREPVAGHIQAAGSTRWLADQSFDRADLGVLLTHRRQLPGATSDTPLLVVSRSGGGVSGPTVLGPEQLLDGWRRSS